MNKRGVKVFLDGSNLSSLLNRFHITTDQAHDPSRDWYAFMIWVRQAENVPGNTPVLIPWRKAKSIVKSPRMANTVGSLDMEALLKIIRQRVTSGWIEEIEILHSPCE